MVFFAVKGKFSFLPTRPSRPGYDSAPDSLKMIRANTGFLLWDVLLLY